MAPEGEKRQIGVQVKQLKSGKARLVFPDGGVYEVRPLHHKKKNSEWVDIALGVAKMAIPQAFSKECSGVGDAGHEEERQSDIESLPNQAEANYQQALEWACPILVGGGYSALDVAVILANEIEQYHVSRELDPFQRKALDKQVRDLSRKIVEFYPGFKPAKKRRKPGPSW